MELREFEKESNRKLAPHQKEPQSRARLASCPHCGRHFLSGQPPSSAALAVVATEPARPGIRRRKECDTRPVINNQSVGLRLCWLLLLASLLGATATPTSLPLIGPNSAQPKASVSAPSSGQSIALELNQSPPTASSTTETKTKTKTPIAPGRLDANYLAGLSEVRSISTGGLYLKANESHHSSSNQPSSSNNNNNNNNNVTSVIAEMTSDISSAGNFLDVRLSATGTSPEVADCKVVSSEGKRVKSCDSSGKISDLASPDKMSAEEEKQKVDKENEEAEEDDEGEPAKRPEADQPQGLNYATESDSSSDDYNDYGAYILYDAPANRSGLPRVLSNRNQEDNTYRVVFFSAMPSDGKRQKQTHLSLSSFPEQVVVKKEVEPNGLGVKRAADVGASVHYSPPGDASNATESSLMLLSVVDEEEKEDEEEEDGEEEESEEDVNSIDYIDDHNSQTGGVGRVKKEDKPETEEPSVRTERIVEAPVTHLPAASIRLSSKYSRRELRLDLYKQPEGETDAGGELDEEDARWLNRMDQRSPSSSGGEGGRDGDSSPEEMPLNATSYNNDQEQAGGLLTRPVDNQATSPTSGLMNNNELGHNIYYWRLVWAILPLGATFGNLLVILAVYNERSLQSVTNYFIVSLAFADLFVGIVVMPFAVYVLVNEVWELSDAICDIYIATDVTSSTASILNLVAISIDRYRAVAHPIAYSARSSSRRAILTIFLVWLISCCVGAPIILGLNTSPERKATLCILYNSTFIFWSSLTSFYIPCILMIGLYWRIFLAIRSRTKKAIGSTSSAPATTNHQNHQPKVAAQTITPSAIMSPCKLEKQPASVNQQQRIKITGQQDKHETSGGLSSTTEPLKLELLGPEKLKTASPSNGGPGRRSSSVGSSDQPLTTPVARVGGSSPAGEEFRSKLWTAEDLTVLRQANRQAAKLLITIEADNKEPAVSAQGKLNLLRMAIQINQNPLSQRELLSNVMRVEKMAVESWLAQPERSNSVDNKLDLRTISLCLMLCRQASENQMDSKATESKLDFVDISVRREGLDLEVVFCGSFEAAATKKAIVESICDKGALRKLIEEAESSGQIAGVLRSKCLIGDAPKQPGSLLSQATCCACCGQHAINNGSAGCASEPPRALIVCTLEPIGDLTDSTADLISLLEITSDCQDFKMSQLIVSIGDRNEQQLMKSTKESKLIWFFGRKQFESEANKFRTLEANTKICTACRRECLLFSSLPIKQPLIMNQAADACFPVASTVKLAENGVDQRKPKRLEPKEIDCLHLSKLLKKEHQTLETSGQSLNVEDGNGSESASEEEEEEEDERSESSDSSSSLSTGFKFNFRNGNNRRASNNQNHRHQYQHHGSPRRNQCQLSASGGDLSYNSISVDCSDLSSSRRSCCQGSPLTGLSETNNTSCAACERLLMATTSCSIVPAISTSKNIKDFFAPDGSFVSSSMENETNRTMRSSGPIEDKDDCINISNWNQNNNCTTVNHCECRTPPSTNFFEDHQQQVSSSHSKIKEAGPQSRLVMQPTTSAGGGIIQNARQKIKRRSIKLGKLIVGANKPPSRLPPISSGADQANNSSQTLMNSSSANNQKTAGTASSSNNNNSIEANSGTLVGASSLVSANQQCTGPDQGRSPSRNKLVSPQSLEFSSLGDAKRTSELNSLDQRLPAAETLSGSRNQTEGGIVASLLKQLLRRNASGNGKPTTKRRDTTTKELTPAGRQSVHHHTSGRLKATEDKVAKATGGSLVAAGPARHRAGSRRRREKNAARRERKATKTLAIVLGIFLICWTPFFTCNIIDGFCIQLEMDCRPGMMVYLVTSWLGYINSCVNPIIYTIFNMEFRRAFKKILISGSCCSR